MRFSEKGKSGTSANHSDDWHDAHAQLQRVQRKKAGDVDNASSAPSSSTAAYGIADYQTMAEDIHRAIKSDKEERDLNIVFSVLQRLNHQAENIEQLQQQYQSLYGRKLISTLENHLDASQMSFALELLTPQAEGDVPLNLREDEFFTNHASMLFTALHTEPVAPAEIFRILQVYSGEEDALFRLGRFYMSLAQNTEELGLVEDLRLRLSGNDLSYALYLMNPPRHEPDPRTQAEVSDQGNQSTRRKFQAGEIVTATSVDFSVTDDAKVLEGKDGFSIGYQGGLASGSSWLQFIWREIIYTMDGEDHWYTEKVPLASDVNPYHFSDGPGKEPDYRVDSNTSRTPFYEALQSNLRSAEGTTLYDAPGNAIEVVAPLFEKPGVTRVRSLAHFNTFLIRGYAPISVVKTTVEWDFDSKDSYTKSISMEEEAASSIPGPMHETLAEHYPAFAYLK